MPKMRDRSSPPLRPDGRPAMRQHWGRVLFLHWPTAAEPMRELLPPELELDLYRGEAWVGVIPFTMWGVRASLLPPVPGIRAFHELNVRTYVRAGNEPGVWFFSLDASSALAVHAARLTYHLPYYCADIELEDGEDTIRYRSVRTHRNAPPARFEAAWRPGAALPRARPGSLEHFLTERYCLYAAHRGKVFRGRIHHEPWPLRRASVESLHSTMIESIGLPRPEGEPLAYHADRLAVEIWPLERVELGELRGLSKELSQPTPVAG